MTGSWKVIGAFVGVFVAGAVFGGFFTARSAGRHLQSLQVTTAPAPVAAQQVAPVRAARSAGQGITPVMLQRIATQLKLTDEQREKVRPIIARAEEDMTWLRRENFRSTNRVLERMHSEIAVLLTDDQRNELEVLKRNMQERMKRAENDRREGGLRKDSTQLNRGGGDAAATLPPKTK